MQIEHQNINKAEKGKVVGVKVKEKVRQHDQVILGIRSPERLNSSVV